MKNKKRTILSLVIFAGISFFAACERDVPVQSQWFDENEYYAGGATTIFDASSAAFSSPANNLSPDNLSKHFEGDLTFEQTYVTAPSDILSGLGPVFNNTSCVSCHTLDGRGAEPSVFRVSVPGVASDGGPVALTGFGRQLQDKAVIGKNPEAKVQITYMEQTFFYADGTPYYLRRPVYELINAYTAVPSDVLISVRAAPPVFGLGLLEAIPELDIINYSDVNDNNKDGISGKPNYVWNVAKSVAEIGRFGWKANQPNLEQQTSAAFNEDMGITNPMFHTESCFGQDQYDGLDDDTEIDFYVTDVTTFYTRTLAVPAPRDLEDPFVMEGKQVFYEANCNSCHKPSWVTGSVADIPEISNQTIYPYTDMLLHNMGDGLADNRTDFLAEGAEWKTRPLWGIGMTQIANGHTNFLHDARARNLEEAILWHGGEAEQSKEYFRNLSKEKRNALITFLKAL
ncbi:MAG: c-type cytochrome [Chitinophagales bacterium]|nr:c-type cytochrome [Chitinophagales bacterium]